jgi:hypothetical protein
MVKAQITNPAINSTVSDLSGAEFISRILSTLIAVGFIAGAVIFFFMLVTGGIQWMSSGSDKTKLEAAKQRIVNALIGLVILFSVYAVILLIENFFGINIISISLDSLSISN